MGCGRILLVEDNFLTRRSIAAVLAGGGHEVVEAEGGQAALSALRRSGAGVVVQNTTLPDIDGALLAARLREAAPGQLRVIGLRGYFANGVEAGVFDRVVVKPVDPHELLLAVSGAAPSFAPEEALARKCAAQRVTLDVVEGVAQALSATASVSLTEVLDRVLDLSGIPAGAIYLKSGAGLSRLALRGLSDSCARFLDAAVFQDPLRARVLAGHELVAFPLRGAECGLTCGDVAAIPIEGRGETLGVLVFARCRVAPDDAEWRAFARATGAAIGQAVTLERTVAALAASERRYRALVENAHDAITVLTPDGVILEVNRRQEEITGRSREQQIGRRFTDFRLPEDVALAEEEFARSLVPGALASPVEIRRPGEPSLKVEFSNRLVNLGDQMVVLSIARDVTRRCAFEDALRLLHAGMLAASEAEDVSSALRITLEYACRATGWEHGTAWLPSDDVLHSRAVWVRDPAALDRFEANTPAALTRGEGMAGTAWNTGALHWCGNIERDSVSPFTAQILGLGIHAMVTIPVKLGAEVVAVLQLFGRAPRSEDADALNLIRAMAAQVGTIISRKRAEEALRRSEAQLFQAQKMEAIGQLTGGIAHDFNNLLSVALMNVGILLEQLPADDPRRADAEEIRTATERAAALTRQLLAFSRRQVLAPKMVSLNGIVSGIEKMLRRVIGEHIRCTTTLGESVGQVYADPGQLEQVLMNLAVNARDAMPRGGELRLETRAVEIASGPEELGKPGRYFALSVTDTGCGMDEETRQRIFEPFFTTKELGRGTGLGLSTCYGIVKQTGGHIDVSSIPGKGTTFHIYLPARDAEPAESPAWAAGAHVGGGETILVVEDEASLRDALERSLRSRGYSVLTASDGAEALALCKCLPKTVDLIVTDVVTPSLSGLDFATRLRESGQNTPILFMSGYVDGLVPAQILRDGRNFLQKPFVPEVLERRVRELLDQRSEGVAA